MIQPRWRKLVRDVRATLGRFIALQIAMVVALAGVGTALGARGVLGREIAESYLGSMPAEATLELAGGVDDALLAELRTHAELADVDRRQMIHARIRAADDQPWQSLVLFIVDDASTLHLGRVTHDDGAWPVPRGALAIERSAMPVLHLAGVGATATVELDDGVSRPMTVATVIHDPGQAPSWQEHRGVGFVARETLRALGVDASMHDLLVTFRPAPGSRDEVEHAATALARSLAAHGHAVHEIRVPELRRHPHQGLMDAVQLVMLAFTTMLVGVCSLVLATMLGAMLARQNREIGVMKAVGARTGQLVAMYGGFVVVIATIAVLIAVPIGRLGAGGLSSNIGRAMNLTFDDPDVPVWTSLAVIALGLGLPLVVAAVPIARATRVTVRRALDGSGRAFVRPILTRLPAPIRDALRRPARVAFTASLLVASGALVLAGANVQRGLSAIAGEVDVSRHYDLEVRTRVVLPDDVIASITAFPGVRAVEAWRIVDAARVAHPDDVPIVHSYPDGGHGSFAIVAPPRGGTTLASFPVVAGRWLVPGDVDAIVLGHNAARGARVGDRIHVAIDGAVSSWTVVGIVEEVGGGSGFVDAAAFARISPSLGAGVLRVAMSARVADVLPAIERVLSARHVGIVHAAPTPLVRSIIDDHVVLVVNAVIAVSVIVALVGLFGLGSAMAIGVSERTREIAVMKAIGATNARIVARVLVEAGAIALGSAVVAAIVALPITAIVIARIADGGFVAPPPFVVSIVALCVWPAIMVAGGAVASVVPAMRAGRMSVRRGLTSV